MAAAPRRTLAEHARIGVSLPHRWTAPPADLRVVTEVARLAEHRGFAELWVTENSLDSAFCLDPVVALTHAAAVTSRIGLGVAVVILPVHHPVHVAQQWASLDALSGGRVVLGVGIGREDHFRAFGVPTGRRVRRFLDAVESVRRLWLDDRTGSPGAVVEIPAGVGVGARPARPGGPPLWFGGAHPDAVRRAARHADGWMAGGPTTLPAFAESVHQVRDELDRLGRDPATFTVSRRLFVAVDDDPARARTMLGDWFGALYGDRDRARDAGVAGRPEEVAARLWEYVEAGADHLVLNPVSDHAAQVAALADIAGLPGQRSCLAR